jgi:hypothetical protein
MALLNYYLMEELEMMDQIDYRSNVQTSLKAHDLAGPLMDLLYIPMVCLCHESFMFYFNDICTYVHMIRGA